MKSPIEKEVLVKAPLSKVWEAWTTNTGAQTFFAPQTRIELVPHGAYEILFFPKEEPGKRGGEGLRILSLLPERMLSFEWNAPPEYPNVRREKNWVVIELIPTIGNETTVRLSHLGWKDGQEWENARQYFVKAWDVVLGRLQHRFEEGPIDWNNPYRPKL